MILNNVQFTYDETYSEFCYGVIEYLMCKS